MQKMFSLLMGMPAFVLVNLMLLMKGRPKRPLTSLEILMRLQAMDELARCLPDPRTLNRFELMSFQVVMEWFNAEMDALRKLRQVHVVMAGTVPFVHDESVAWEKLS
jgi:hypothetical protein